MAVVHVNLSVEFNIGVNYLSYLTISSICIEPQGIYTATSVASHMQVLLSGVRVIYLIAMYPVHLIDEFILKLLHCQISLVFNGLNKFSHFRKYRIVWVGGSSFSGCSLRS